MAQNILLNSLQTGLLGYSRKKNFLGDGINFRETENIKLECFISDFNNFSPSLLQNQLINTFQNLYSGNVYVNVFNAVGNFNDTNDSVRILKFNVEIENRIPISDNFISQPELTSNSMFSGINGNFWNSYYNLFNTFDENYSYDKKPDGSISTNHIINFNLLTGGYNAASGIASYIYSADVGNGFYTNLTSSLISGNNFIDPTKVRQIYTENYDILKNNYAFSKKTEYPSLTSENNNSITKEIKNTMILDDNGIITITENGKIKAFLDFFQAVNEYSGTAANNIIYNRCSGMYSSFINFGNIIGNSQLNNYPIKNETIYNKPGLIVEYTISYNDDPNFLNTIYDVIIGKTIEIDLIDNKYINITHNYDFNRIANINPIQTGVMTNLILNADVESSGVIPSYYQNSQLYNPYLPNLPRIKETFSLPVRRRNFGAKFIYSNEPIYFINVSGNTYPKLEYKIINNIPKDIINEYIIVNPPTNATIVSYQYQSEMGDKTININGFLNRNYGQTFLSPQNINNQFFPLFQWGVNTLMSTFNNLQVLALSYYLSDYKIRFDSDNGYEMSITISYIAKKYNA